MTIRLAVVLALGVVAVAGVGLTPKPGWACSDSNCDYSDPPPCGSTECQ